MMMDQLAFSHMLSEAHERHLDELRSEVQHFFDGLSPRQKDFLGTWLGGTTTYDTCVALGAAAGDWNNTRQEELRNVDDVHRGGSGNGAARPGALPAH